MAKGVQKFIIVLICGFFSQKLCAQIVNKKVNYLFGQSSFSVIANKKFSLDSLTSSSIKLPVLQPDYYVRNLAFFCRQEWKMERTTGLPFRFRLGSLEQCNRLEGK